MKHFRVIRSIIQACHIHSYTQWNLQLTDNNLGQTFVCSVWRGCPFLRHLINYVTNFREINNHLGMEEYCILEVPLKWMEYNRQCLLGSLSKQFLEKLRDINFWTPSPPSSKRHKKGHPKGLHITLTTFSC